LFTILAGSTGPVSYQHVGENSGDNEKNRRRNSENEHGQTEDGVRGGSAGAKYSLVSTKADNIIAAKPHHS